MKCAAHPNVETNLACGKCGIPICPKCLVQTPVGARCRNCAGVKRLPTYQITPLQYLKAAGLGLVLAIAIGIAWAWLRDLIPLFSASLLLSIALAAGAGYAIGEVISRSVNRKRGTALQVIAGVGVALSYVVSNVGFSGDALTFFTYISLYDILVLAVGIMVAVVRLR